MLFTDSDILERVDEYSLFCHYLGFDPLLGRKYSSPLRKGDDNPSFGIFERANKYNLPNEYMWKDQAHPEKQHGDIFDLVELLFGLSNRVRSYWKVCADFGLGGHPGDTTQKLVLKDPPKEAPAVIRIVSRPFAAHDLEYWAQYGVSNSILAQYNVTALKAYWLTEQQPVAYYAPKLGFAYRIGSKYQLYFPKNTKSNKFRNNWDYKVVPGLSQLQYNSDTLIITKSMKDVMCLRALGYEAIAPRGEGILLPQPCIAYVQKRYSKIFVLFDNDGKHRAQDYPFVSIELPVEHGAKDITDYYALHGRNQTACILKTLLHEPAVNFSEPLSGRAVFRGHVSEQSD